MTVRIVKGDLRPAGSTTTYVHTDGLRSPIATTDELRAVTLRMRYEPYGAPTNGIHPKGPGYAGHVEDASTGLVYMQQRYYDPIAGRFLSTDPIAASAASFNRYAYAANNPYKNIDPDGRNPAVIVAGCAASAACVGVAAAGAGIAVAGIEASGDSIGPVMSAAIAGVQLINGAMKSEAKSPDVPKGLVGTKDGAGGEQGKRVNNGPLAPEHGGTGDSEKDFGSLTGGKYTPAPSDKGYPEGARVGENGISHRPATEKSGPRIDIPANGDKPHETLHYPKK